MTTPLRTVTLKDVAQKAGVSVMTVSRALRNSPNISKETREKIRRLADAMGYRPNPLVSALMTYRRSTRPPTSHSTLAFVTNFAARDEWRGNRLFMEFFEGAAERANQHGYRVEEFWLREPGMSAERLSKILFNRNVPGLLIAPQPVAHGHLTMDWEHFAAVTFGYSLAHPQVHRAANHQFRSMRMALRQLRKYGYRRIGFSMSAALDRRVDDQWSGCFLAEQRHADSASLPMFLVEPDHWNQERFTAWLKKNRPDVVIGQQPEIMDWIRKAGLHIPRDIGFVHLNCPDTSGSFAGIRQNGRAVGRVAVDFLVGMLQRNERGLPELAHTILVEGTWVDGATLRPQSS